MLQNWSDIHHFRFSLRHILLSYMTCCKKFYHLQSVIYVHVDTYLFIQDAKLGIRYGRIS